MPKSGGEINAPLIGREARVCQEGKRRRFPLEIPVPRPHIKLMNYILAILLPPLSILLTGRPFLAILVFLIWVPALFFSGGLTHPMFIILAWFLIHQGVVTRDRR